VDLAAAVGKILVALVPELVGKEMPVVVALPMVITTLNLAEVGAELEGLALLAEYLQHRALEGQA
jgi:hypothetical protein